MINVSFEAGDSQRSTRTLQEALQSWCKEQTPALTVDNFLIVGGGGSAEFEIHPAPGTVPRFYSPWNTHKGDREFF